MIELMTVSKLFYYFMMGLFAFLALIACVLLEYGPSKGDSKSKDNARDCSKCDCEEYCLRDLEDDAFCEKDKGGS